jgi:hypothetical protein
MRAKFVAVVLGVLIATVAQAAGPKVREVPVQFPKGETGVSLKGKLKGDETVDYKVRAAAGQSMAIVFKPGNPSAYFNVLPPGSDSAIFIGSTSGNRFEGALPADGTYTIRVYLMRSAARRNESTSYALDVGVSSGTKKPVPNPAGRP